MDAAGCGYRGIFRHFDLLRIPEYKLPDEVLTESTTGNLDDFFVFILPASSGNASLDGLIGLYAPSRRHSGIPRLPPLLFASFRAALRCAPLAHRGEWVIPLRSFGVREQCPLAGVAPNKTGRKGPK